MVLACGALYASPVAAQLGSRAGQLFEFQEWSITAPATLANPFDLQATATFTPVDGGPALTTGLYYDGTNGPGEHVYKFRFTGLQQGLHYNITTTGGGVAALDGLTGSLNIVANPDPGATGFLTHVGNKFARQVGNHGELRGELFNVYMNLQQFGSADGSFPTHPVWSSPASRQAYFDQVKANGANVGFMLVSNHFFELGTARRTDLTGPGPYNPYAQTFEIIEQAVQHAREEGLHLHLWAWGDDTRRYTPPGDDNRQLDINGDADLRLQRYLAARLAPLPGWSMGYGFDLNEWTDESQVQAWAQGVTDASVNDHLLFARAYAASDGPAVNDAGDNTWRASALSGHSYATETNGSAEGPGLETTGSGGPTGYLEVAQDLAAGPDKPHLYEERFTFNRTNGYWSEQRTRQHYWRHAIAGGAGAWWGFFNRTDNQGPPTADGYSAETRDQLQTFDAFWRTGNRFHLDMLRHNAITGNPVLDGGADNGQYALQSEANDLIVVYAEDASTIRLNLASLQGDPGWALGAHLVAVDVLGAYNEIDLGVFALADFDLDLSAFPAIDDPLSDWALSIRGVALPADANADGVVDLLDFDVLAFAFGNPTELRPAGASGGDFNSDGNVDLLDFDILAFNFGAPGNTPAVVPEPASLGVLALGAAGLLSRRRATRPTPA
ncbi:MAG: PEP-CTERM sorting domain-containing protein [Planctomycetota bacterium]